MPTDRKDVRDNLRKECLEQRRSLDSATNDRESLKAVAQLEKLFEFLKVETPLVIASYRSRAHVGELSVDSLFSNPAFSPHGFCFPRIESAADGVMTFSLCTKETDFSVTALQILEPLKTLPSLSPDEIDLFLVPGVVFNESGERMGLGKGYYDRYLGKAPKALRVGMAHEFQVKTFPLDSQSWDQNMDYLVTPDRFIDCRANGIGS